ncbi:hypothetical protein NC652_009299 [Populus alba x Populus x berolinensis]|nr:hypothetical protein NC652_009299 [Populus alba x Populus x berolinensis]
MAEAAVSFVIQRLADSLDRLEFHTDVRREVERLQDELRRMRCFLRDADAKQDVDERVCNWVSDIRNVAYDAEDLIDTFTLKISPLKKKHFIRRYTSLVKEWKQRSQIAEGLAALRSRLQDISASRDTYGIQNIGEGTATAIHTSVPSSSLELSLENFRLLRILELEGISCGRIPSTIGDLIHLSYLGLKETNIQVLPSTLGSLCNLQTLDIARNLHLRIVPNVIWNMRNLRHLYMCGQSGGFLRIDNLKHLQTLSGIDVSRWKQNNSAHLTSLRKLKMRGNLSLDTIAIFDSISALLQLRSLYLRAEGAEFPKLSQLGSLHSLVKLHLKGGITRLPSLQEFPPNLSQLTLEYTHLEQESIEVLEKLPKLSIFRLKAKSYSKEELGISANGFPQLEFLEFNSLESLTELKIEASALPRLEIFQIVNCKELRMLPEEMKLMTRLKTLTNFFALQDQASMRGSHFPYSR